MSSKNLLLVLFGIIVIIFFGFYIYNTSVVSINTPTSVSYSGKLMPNFNDANTSASQIIIAEEKLSEVEILIGEMRAKDLSEYSFFHRKFLESMKDLVEKRFKESSDKLDSSREAFRNKEYFKAGEDAYLSGVISSVLPWHINNILEGRKKEDWNGESAIETVTFSNQTEVPVDEYGEPIRNVTPPEDPSAYPATTETPR